MPPTMTPARVISSPADHQVRSVKRDFDAPTRKCAISDTIAAVITPVVPRNQKNGMTGTIATTKVLMPAEIAHCSGLISVVWLHCSLWLLILNNAAGLSHRCSGHR